MKHIDERWSKFVLFFFLFKFPLKLPTWNYKKTNVLLPYKWAHLRHSYIIWNWQYNTCQNIYYMYFLQKGIWREKKIEFILGENTTKRYTILLIVIHITRLCLFYLSTLYIYIYFIMTPRIFENAWVYKRIEFLVSSVNNTYL
jgi:hypothetical protein